MKKFSFLAAIAIAMFLQSCGGSKQVANAGYYNNPYPQQQYQQQSIQQQMTLYSLEDLTEFVRRPLLT